MKKTILSLLAIAAIALTGCKTDEVKTFEFAQSEVSVEATKFVQLALKVTPANSDAWINWESDNENVAVLAGGSGSAFVRSVKGVSAGTANITAKVQGDLTKSATCLVKVYTVAPTDIVFSCSKEDSVKMDFTNNVITLIPNTRFDLVATVLPDTASFRTVTWKSSNDSIVTVNDRGVIEASRPGTATITVTDYLNIITKTITVNVNKIPVTGIFVMAPASFDKLEAEMEYLIRDAYAILPATASNRNVTVTSSDENVVRIINKDSIYTVAPGTATITIVTEEGGFTGSFNATVVTTPLKSFKIDADTAYLYVGDKYDIPCTFTPANATNKTIVGESDNTAVVEVIDGNSIKVVGEGTATVTLTADGNRKASIVIVATIGVESVTCTEEMATIHVGETYEIAYTIAPVEATNKNVKMSIEDPTILEKAGDASVKALRVGRTSVTLITEDGDKTDKIIIKVEE